MARRLFILALVFLAVFATRTETHEILCKVCGHTLLHADDHITGTVLSGPRVAAARHEPELGPKGTLHDILRSASSSSPTSSSPSASASPLPSDSSLLPVALFRDTAGSALMLGSASDKPVFPGYRQRQVLCSRCSHPIGWRFEKEGAVGAGAGAGAGAAAYAAASGAGASATAGSAPAASTAQRAAHANEPPLQVVPYDAADEERRLRVLEGQCWVVPRGWWTFEVCHTRRVHQFHKEPDGTVAPDWSLGEYDMSGKVERARPIAPATGYYTSHFFVGGQKCDETGRGRATEVQYFCCSHARGSAAFVEDIEEPSLCRYRAKVCVPSLCQVVGAAGADGGATGAATQTPSGGVGSATGGAPADGPAQQAAAGSVEGSSSPLPPDGPSAGSAEASVGAPDASSPPPLPFSPQEAATGTGAETGPFRPAPPKAEYDPSSVPASFLAVTWAAVLGEQGDVYRDLAGGDFATGISHVRFVG
jgi:hypothetical protein